MRFALFRRLTGLGTALAALVVPAFLGAQASVALRGPSCTNCKVTLTTVATLRDSAFKFWDLGLIIGEDAQGRFVVSGGQGDEVALFDRSGRYIRRVAGPAPAEGQLRHVFAIMRGPGDSIHLFDSFRRRQVVLDPEVTRVVRSDEMRSFGTGLIQPDGSLLASGAFRETKAVGQPLHIIRAGNEIQRSFGLDSASYDARDVTSLFRAVNRRRQGGYWISPLNTYTIEEWTPDFTKRRTLTRSVPWFKPASGRYEAIDAIRPRPLMRGAREDAQGRLWVSIGVAKERWAPAPGADATKEGPPITIPESAEYVDTILEAVDPVDGRVLASTRFPWVLGWVGDGPLVWRFRVDAAGRKTVDILKMDLVVP